MKKLFTVLMLTIGIIGVAHADAIKDESDLITLSNNKTDAGDGYIKFTYRIANTPKGQYGFVVLRQTAKVGPKYIDFKTLKTLMDRNSVACVFFKDYARYNFHPVFINVLAVTTSNGPYHSMYYTPATCHDVVDVTDIKR